MIAEPGRQPGDGDFVEADQRARHHRLAEVVEPLKRRRRLVGQEEAIGAPVGGVVAPLDEAGSGQLVDQAREGDRREVEQVGQFTLLDALGAAKLGQHGPLGARHVDLAGALIRIGAQHARHVVQGETEFSGRRQGGQGRSHLLYAGL